MNKTKTINFNPLIFSLNKTKSKKKDNSINKPLISPNILKNKLLKRIKEHKNRKTENLVIDENKNINDDYDNDNEFENSINYLQTLSKQKKVNDEKNNYEKNKQKNKEELQRKTIKTYSSLPILDINLDLP